MRHSPPTSKSSSWTHLPCSRRPSPPSLNCIQPTTPPSAVRSTPAIRSSTAPRHGTRTICIWLPDGSCSREPRHCSHCLRTSSRSSSQATTRLKEVSTSYALSLSRQLDRGLLVFHASELSLLFGPVPTPVEDDFANQFTDFYINFINDLNPGSTSDSYASSRGHSLGFAAEWPRYESATKKVLQLMRDNITVIPDGMTIFFGMDVH